MLLEDLQEVAVSWLIIGLYLKIPYYKLNIIKEDNRGCVICLTAMLDSWLTGNGVPATDACFQFPSSSFCIVANKLTILTEHEQHV